jgi:hypothetical protein
LIRQWGQFGSNSLKYGLLFLAAIHHITITVPGQSPGWIAQYFFNTNIALLSSQNKVTCLAELEKCDSIEKSTILLDVTLQSGRSSTIQRNVLPQSSGPKSKARQGTVRRVICVLLPPNFLPPVGSRISLLHIVQIGSGVHPTSYPMGTWRSFSGGKAAEAWSWPVTYS